LNSILAVESSGAIASHLVVSKDEKNLKGTMVLSNTDKESLTKNKDELSKTLTQKVQADTKNANSKVEVNEVRELSDGTLALDYECKGVSDQETAKKTLNNAVRHDDVKKTIVKSSKKDAATAKPQQKVTSQERESYLQNILTTFDVRNFSHSYKKPISLSIFLSTVTLIFIELDFIHPYRTFLLPATWI